RPRAHRNGHAAHPLPPHRRRQSAPRHRLLRAPRHGARRVARTRFHLHSRTAPPLCLRGCLRTLTDRRARHMRPSSRLWWMLPAALSMLAGLDAALLLLGFPAPVTFTRLPESHGMLLALGFVGTLVALERSTALRAWW